MTELNRRRYTWQTSLRNQVELMRYLGLAERHWKALPGLRLVPWTWLRLHLATVGPADEITYAEANAVAERVADRIETVEPFDIELPSPTAEDNSVGFAIPEHPQLNAIKDIIRAATDKPTMDVPVDNRVTIAHAEQPERAIEALSDADLPQPLTLRILGISHVLLNPATFDTAIWTNLDRCHLAGTTYPG